MVSFRIGIKIFTISIISVFSIVIIVQLNGIRDDLKQVNSRLRTANSWLGDIW